MKSENDVIIGLEIHVQLNTNTKLFCGCPTQGEDEPNTRCCEVCLGMPGSKPVLNKKALEYALRLCLATGCKVSPELIFSRKSYFYPDMAKNYQISQYEIPLGVGGSIQTGEEKEVSITRIHMEEDPASLLHSDNSNSVLIDYNRSGIPLCELVTEPEITSPEEAKNFMKSLRSILKYLKIFDINNCVVKADANISAKESDYKRVEIKNISGFKDIEKALQYEVERHKKEPEKVEQETRGWDGDKEITFSMRKKETEEEYGYIIDPDLVVNEIDNEMVESVRNNLPELAKEKAKRFIEEHKLRKEDAEIIAEEKELSEVFERAIKHVSPSLATSWIRHELNRVLNYNKKTLEEIELDEEQMVELLKMIENKEITENVGQKILEKLSEENFDVRKYVEDNNLKAVSDSGKIEEVCKEAIDESPKAIEDYKNGSEKSLNYVVGQVMKKTKGAASPQEVMKKIKELLD